MTEATMASGSTLDAAVDPVAVPVVAAAKKKRSVVVYACYAWLFLVIAAAILADVLPIANYQVPVAAPRLTPSFDSLNLLLGTDNNGRSMLSRCVYGARISLLVGTIASLVGITIGTTLGLLGGYIGKATDWVIRLLTDTMLAFPPLILLLALTSALQPSLTTVTVGLSLVGIPSFTRLVRANTVSWASRDFVRAARNLGASSSRILVKEILPNVVPPLIAFVPTIIAALIVAEGSLSFLGLGIPAPRPSWGGMINDGQTFLQTAPQLILVPAAVIVLTIFALNQVGDHLRVRFDRTMQD